MLSRHWPAIWPESLIPYTKAGALSGFMLWPFDKNAPSGWARAKIGPRGAQTVIHKFYHKYQHSHIGGHHGRKEYGEEKTAPRTASGRSSR